MVHLLMCHTNKTDFFDPHFIFFVNRHPGTDLLASCGRRWLRIGAVLVVRNLIPCYVLSEYADRTWFPDPYCNRHFYSVLISPTAFIGKMLIYPMN